MAGYRRVKVDADVLARRLDALAGIGATRAGGITRLAYSAEERAAFSLVGEWMTAAGLDVRVDAAGNMFGRWPPLEGAAVWTGSHLDSVPSGGRFDGPAGVLASLAAVEALQVEGATPRGPIDVCVFVGEEGSRFAGGLLGSRAVVDGLSGKDLSTRDSAGTSMADAMRACGLDPARAADARVAPEDVRVYLELHIEQGPVLERADVPVGIVTGIAGPVFFSGKMAGRADHAGTTPMDARRDSLVGVAELAVALEDIARRAGPVTVATIGRVECFPGASNVVPSRTTFSVDLRDVDVAARDRAEHDVRATLDEISARRGLTYELREEIRIDPMPVAPEIVATLGEAAAAAGVRAHGLHSGAAHDAMIMGRIAPAGMLFVRSIGGRSHTPEEATSIEDLAAGAAVLAGALARLAGARVS